MWLYTKVGFFSVVAPENPSSDGREYLVVRARVRKDLENLGEKYLPNLGNIIETKTSDYRFRAIVPKAEFGMVMYKIVKDIDYPNFKDAVKKEQGEKRAHVYGSVWAVTSGGLSSNNNWITSPKTQKKRDRELFQLRESKVLKVEPDISSCTKSKILKDFVKGGKHGK